MTTEQSQSAPGPDASTEGALESEAECARSEAPEADSGLAVRQVKVLANLALLHRRQLSRTVMLHVAILWAHHLGIPKKDILEQSGLKKSKMHEVIRKTQQFVERLQRDAELDYRPPNLDGTGGHFVLSCSLCDGGFESVAPSRVGTYPEMQHHWREQHGWSPEDGESPKASAKWLPALGSGPLADPANDIKTKSEAYWEVQRLTPDKEPSTLPAAMDYGEALDGATGDALAGALETIVQHEHAMLREQMRAAQRRRELGTALQDIRRHAFEAEYLRLGCNLEIARALELQVSTATIADIIGVAATTVERWGAQYDAHLRAMAELLGLVPESAGDAGHARLRKADRNARTEAMTLWAIEADYTGLRKHVYRMLGSEAARKSEDPSHRFDSQSIYVNRRCLRCRSTAGAEPSRQEWAEHVMSVHWRIMHGLLADATETDDEITEYHHRTLEAVFGDGLTMLPVSPGQDYSAWQAFKYWPPI